MSNRSRSLSPERNSDTRSRSRIPSPESREMSPSGSDEAESSGLIRGDKFENLRESTRDVRKKNLLERVTNMAEFSAKQGDYTVNMRVNVPDDLKDWLIDELRSRGIYVELENDELYMELDKHWSSDDSSDDDEHWLSDDSSDDDEPSRSNDTTVLYYVLGFMLLAILFCVFPALSSQCPTREELTNLMNKF